MKLLFSLGTEAVRLGPDCYNRRTPVTERAPDGRCRPPVRNRQTPNGIDDREIVGAATGFVMKYFLLYFELVGIYMFSTSNTASVAVHRAILNLLFRLERYIICTYYYYFVNFSNDCPSRHIGPRREPDRVPGAPHRPRRIQRSPPGRLRRDWDDPASPPPRGCRVGRRPLRGRTR